MIDAWMKMLGNVSEHAVGNWNDANQTVPTLPVMPTMISPELAMPAASPVFMPVLASAAAANAAVATWAGFWMAAPLAGAAALGVVTGGTSQPVAKAPKLTKPVTRKAPPKTAAKAVAKTASKAATKASSVKAASAKTGAAKAKSVKPAAAKAVGSKVTDRPTGLDAPRGGKADDLKRISGVGPKLESVLNDLGIYHFEQIAVWTPKQTAWVDDYLRFKGRIERDGWIAQAKTFAKEVA